MAFDTTTAASRRTPLMEIDLGSSTLRYSDESITLSDNTHYENRILSFPTIQLTLGRTVEATLRRPAVTVVLDNTDRAISDLFDANDGFAGKAVTLKLGSGTNVADYETRFVGCRRYPGNVSWDHSRFSISLEWDLISDMRVLPKNTFLEADYANIDDSAKFKPIPYIIGDFRSTATPAQQVPCYRVNTTTGTGGAFKIAEVLQSIENVYLNGVATSYTVTDATAGEFTLDVSYSSGDVVTAHVLGATTATFTGDGAEFSLPRIMYDLLTNSDLLNLSTSRLLTTAFATWETFLDSTVVGRRWIGTPVSSATLLAELASDGFADLYINPSNEYVPVYRKTPVSESLTTFREGDLLPDAQTERRFSVNMDPERLYANVVIGDYALEPSPTVSHLETAEEESSTAIATLGARRTRRFQMNWLYSSAAAQPRAALELSTYSTEVTHINITLGPPGLTILPTNRFRLAYSAFETPSGGNVFYVRSVAYDYTRMQATIEAVGVSGSFSGYWTNDAAPNWATANAAQKAAQGFWTDASGESDTESRWF